MRATLILIKREIEDYGMLYLLAAVIGCVAAVTTYLSYGPIEPRSSHEIPKGVMLVLLYAVPNLAILAVITGSMQMGVDRTTKMASFLVTLTPTRSQVFWAKWLAGLLWIVLALLPLFALHGYELTQRDLDAYLMSKLAMGICLLLLASHGLGLQLGLMSRTSLALISGVIVLAALFMLLLFITGLGGGGFWLLLLISILFLTRAWSRFKTLSL